MVALFYRGVPIVFAEGVGARVREGLHLTLSRLSPLVRSQCVIDYYVGAYPLDGVARMESLATYHDVVCPVADGVKVHACEICEGEVRDDRRAYI